MATQVRTQASLSAIELHPLDVLLDVVLSTRLVPNVDIRRVAQVLARDPLHLIKIKYLNN